MNIIDIDKLKNRQRRCRPRLEAGAIVAANGYLLQHGNFEWKVAWIDKFDFDGVCVRLKTISNGRVVTFWESINCVKYINTFNFARDNKLVNNKSSK